MPTLDTARSRLRANLPLVVLFLLLVVTTSVYLHRVPGLMGDEGSEGTNVFELLERDRATLQGERSYIGVWIDYFRIPFMKVLGATTLAIRLPIFLFSLATFWLAASVFRRLFGRTAGMFALVGFLFSPIFLTHQRFGWAVSLFPFFALLALFFFLSHRPLAPLFFGATLGLGLNTHLLFFPAVVGIGAPWVIRTLWRSHRFRSLLLAALGFCVMFAPQFFILRNFTEDQGNPREVLETTFHRVRDLPSLLPVVLSGSSFVAHYTGTEFPKTAQYAISAFILIAAGSALALQKRKAASWIWVLGLILYLCVLLLIIDRFSLRYFALWTMGIWALAGTGIGTVIDRLTHHRSHTTEWLPVIAGGVLSLVFLFVVILPFLKTGGSTNTFSLGNREDTSSAVVDIRGLIACIRNAGPVFSENIHIRNRIAYLGFTDPSLKPAENLKDAQWAIEYRTKESSPASRESCPDLAHFRVSSP